MRTWWKGAVAAAVLAGTAACAANEAEGTSEAEFLHGAGGVHTQVGGMLLRDVSFDEPADGVYDAGDVARLRVVLFNDSAVDDALMRVETPVAGAVRLLTDLDCDGEAEHVGRIPLPSYPRGEPPVPTSPDGPEPYYRVDVVMDERVRAGESVPVTFQFAKAGATTVQVPVEAPQRAPVDDDAECEPIR